MNVINEHRSLPSKTHTLVWSFVGHSRYSSILKYKARGGESASMWNEKFTVPISGIDVIERPDLDAKLMQSIIQHRVTFVTAPAGSGKSVTLARLFEVCPAFSLRPIWFSCEDSDRDETQFLRQLESAIMQHKGPFEREMGTQMESLVGSIRRLGEPIALFLDNYHLCETASLNDMLLRLVQRCHDKLRVILSSRIFPQMNIAALRMRTQIGEFTRSDLAIERDEVAHFINVDARYLTEEQKDLIITRTEGWVAALQFIRLIVGKGGSIDQIVDEISSAENNTRDYLSEEVFRSLSADMKNYLLKISHLDRISSGLSAHLCSDMEGEKCYKELIDRNLFVIPLDRNREWIKLHSVFKDFLIIEARRKYQNGIRDDLMKAAYWHWEHGNWLEAVHYALDAGKSRIAAEWLQRCGETLVTDHGEVVAFRLCCERIVDSGAASHDLIQWMVWTAAFSVSWMDAYNLISRHQLSQEFSAAATNRTKLLQILLTFFSHDFVKTSEQGQKWWDSSENDTYFDRATVAAMMAFCFKILLRQRQTSVWLNRARTEISNTTGGYGRMWVHGISAYMAVVEGRPQNGLQEAKDALAEYAASPASMAILGPVIAAASYEIDDIETAQSYADVCISGLDGCAAIDIAFCAYRVQAMARLASSGAEDALMQVETWLGGLTRRFGERGFTMMQWLKRDIASRVSSQKRENLLRQYNIIAASDGGVSLTPDLQEWGRIIEARLHVLDGRPELALDIVKGIILSSMHEERLQIWTEASVIKAASLKALGEKRAAERILLDCLTKIAPRGMVRTILDQQIFLRPFAAFLADDKGSMKWIDPQTKALVGKVLEILGKTVVACMDDEIIVPVEALTKQETIILSLLADGLNNAEICDRLVLTLATVKWHIYNIYQKMNVHSRTSAVREGRALGLLN